MAQKPFTLVLDPSYADPDATPEMFLATKTIVEVLDGFSQKTSYTALMNAVAIVICRFSDTETKAMDDSHRFRRQLDRCIGKNYATMKAAQTGKKSGDENR